MIIGTIPASATGTINLTYLPEFLFFEAPVVPTLIRVTALGDGVILDMDGNGLHAVNGIDSVTRVPNGFLIRLSDGLIPGRNIEIVITNPVAGVLTVHGFSTRQGSFYVQYLRQIVLANSGQTFRDFSLLALPGLAPADTIDINYQDGTSQRFVSVELRQLIGVNGFQAIHPVVVNFDGTVKSVTVIPAAQITAILQRYADVNAVNGSLNNT